MNGSTRFFLAFMSFNFLNFLHVIYTLYIVIPNFLHIVILLSSKERPRFLLFSFRPHLSYDWDLNQCPVLTRKILHSLNKCTSTIGLVMIEFIILTIIYSLIQNITCESNVNNKNLNKYAKLLKTSCIPKNLF